MWNTLRDQLEKQLSLALKNSNGDKLHNFKLRGSVVARGAGSGWEIQVRFQDSLDKKKIIEVLLGSGPRLEQELADLLEAWVLEKSNQHPGRTATEITLLSDA